MQIDIVLHHNVSQYDEYIYQKKYLDIFIILIFHSIKWVSIDETI